MQSTVTIAGALPQSRSDWRERLGAYLPFIILIPSLIASFVYVFVFTGWTLYISLSNSSLLPSYDFVGFEHYVSLWQNRRWNIAYTNLFLFGVLLRHRHDGDRAAACDPDRPAGARRSGLADDLSLSAGRLLRRHRHGLELALQSRLRHRVSSCVGLGLTSFEFRAGRPDRKLAIYAIVITGIWQASGFAMALFLAGLRSVDQDLIKAAQIDGAGMARIYRRIVIPAIGPIFIAVAGRAAAVRHQDLRPGRRADARRARHRDDLSGDLRLRPDVPARPDRRRRGGGDHDPARARVVLVPYSLSGSSGAGAGRAGHG